MKHFAFAIARIFLRIIAVWRYGHTRGPLVKRRTMTRLCSKMRQRISKCVRQIEYGEQWNGVHVLIPIHRYYTLLGVHKLVLVYALFSLYASLLIVSGRLIFFLVRTHLPAKNHQRQQHNKPVEI